ncbi:MAG: insulinase family protein [Deltaproteobacteria bacterium]|nr:insulinase family protein [Deltaproteobacteria bacterium]
MKVVLQPDPAEPMVAINLRYRVGSWWDPKGREGLAHLLEHLMFAEGEGSDALGVLEASGALRINAVTGLERTEYQGLVPPEVVPRALWLEARRMAGIDPNTVSRRLEQEKRVVVQELRERLYDQPYGAIEGTLQARLFPEPHPLHHLPIGSEASVFAATVEEVLAFHRLHYGPKHSCLVLAGPISVEEVRALITTYFGPLAPQEAPPAALAPAPVLKAEPIFGPEWTSGYSRVSLVWHAPNITAPESRALEVFGAMLSFGATSRAGIANLAQQSILNLKAGRYDTPAGGLFRVDAIVSPGASPLIARSRVRSVIETYIEYKPQPEELAGTTTRLQVEVLRAVGDLEARARLLQDSRAEFGNAAAVLSLAKLWSEVSATEIQEVLNKHLTHEPQVLVAQPVRR